MMSVNQIQKTKELAFLVLIFTAIFITFVDVFFLKVSFVSGDHRAQHFPWGFFFQQELRQGHFPVWTSLIQCGFPLMAEGQVAALYPINWIFYLILPFHVAYSYEILFHFIFGAFFFYWFIRSIGVERWGALFAAFVYVFGSAHAGFFYNMTSQRVAVWFPLSLILINRLFENPKMFIALLIGIVFALESLAGYQQIAVYVIGFAALYFFWRLICEKHKYSIFILTGYFTLALVYSFLVSSPQWFGFLQLAHFSSRTELIEAFAYVGSANPISLFSLIFPMWGSFFNAKLYIGVLSVFFFLVSITNRRNKYENVMLFLLIVGFLLALGQFSPLYIALVKTTHFYGFRVPSKFLFFVSFSLSVLSGFGFDKFMNNMPVRLAAWIFGFFVASGLLILSIGKIFLELIRNPLMNWLRNYVADHIFGSSIHPHSLETYYAKLNSMFDGMLLLLTPTNSWNVMALLIIAVSIITLLIGRSKKVGILVAKVLLTAIVFADLFAYGFVSIKGDYEAFAFVEQPNSKIIKRLKMDRDTFRIYEFYRLPEEKDRFPIASNFNMIHGIPDIGIYSPLAFKRYKTFLSRFGSVDDSLFSKQADEKAIEQDLKFLSNLSVKYILSLKELYHPKLEFLMRDKDVLLYQNHDVMPRAYFYDNSGKIEPVQIVRDGQTFLELKGDFSNNGIVHVSDLNYPGWKAFVNGTETPIQSSKDLFRVVSVQAGANKILMIYQPTYLKLTAFISLISLALLVFALILRCKLI